MSLTIETSRECSKHNSVHNDTRMSHVDKSFPAGLGVEISLIDIVGKDRGHGNEFCRRC